MAKTIRLIAWSSTGLFTLAFLTQPVSAGAQLAMACAVIVFMTAVWIFGRGVYARWAFLALGSLVVIRYIFWRATYTLPPLDQPINFMLGLLLVVAELYCVLILVISLIINADPLDRKPLPREDDDLLPTVDVFVPTYNEDEYILATTLAAARLMDYPADKLTIWLLDDGGSDQKVNDKNPVKAAAAMARRVSLQKLCDDLGARYLTRAKNEHAKAGNMNNGLKHATGEIIVVFDADHAPFKSFLRETVGHFARDPMLFLVQTPHVFLNPDPIERNLRTFKNMPSENEMFYSVTQRGLDKWNGSFFCGSAALLRRRALDVTGGFSGITITEDCETAFELHAQGWNSVFVDKPLIAGLQPETFESFIGQRSRWCQGMFQILMLKNPLFKKGLKPIQKLAYLSSMTFWFFPLPRMIFTFAPLLHIFFDVKIFVSSMDEALAYTATYMVVNLMLQNYLYGRVRWPFISELYEYVQGVYLAKAIVSVIISPHKPTFNVTAKGLSLDEDHLSGLAQPFFLIFGMLLIGALTAFYRYFFEPGAELMLIVGLWTSFNLLIAGVALGVVAERREPDRFPRLTIERRGIVPLDGAELAVSIQSVSAGGCSFRFTDTASAPARLADNFRCSLVVSSLDGTKTFAPLKMNLVHATTGPDVVTYGFAFVDMEPSSYVALADLMYGDPDAMLRFQTKRRIHKNLLSGSLQFLFWGTLEPIRAIRLAAKRMKSAPEPAVATAATTAPVAVIAQDVTALVEAPPILVAMPVAPPVATDIPAISSVKFEGLPQPLAVEAVAGAASDQVLSVQSVRITEVEPVSVSDELSLASTLDEDFDALSVAFSELPPVVETITAGWLSTLLNLAAEEMKRDSESTGEPAHAVASVAA